MEGSEVLRHRVGDAVNARAPRAQPPENIGGDIGEMARVGLGRVHLKLPPPV